MIRLLARSSAAVEYFIRLTADEARILARSLDRSFWFKFILELDIRNKAKLIKRLISRMISLECEDLITPPKGGFGYRDGISYFENERIDILLFSLWAKRCEPKELIEKVSISWRMNEAFKIHENKKLFIDALLNVHAADHTILAGINRMYEKDGIQRFHSEFPTEFENLAKLLMGRKTPAREGSCKKFFLKYLFSQIPELAWKLLDGNAVHRPF